MKHRAYSLLGNVAIVNFPDEYKLKDKMKFAKEILEKNKSVKTVLEKTGKFKGRLRKMETKHLAGEKTKEVLYKENHCIFRFNIDETYFSPRLSNERKEIAEEIRKGDLVLVMFAGVGPFSLVIGKNTDCKKVYSNEINRKANKYGKLNIELNNLKGKVELLPGDIKKVAKKIKNAPKLKISGATKSKAVPSRRSKDQGFAGYDVIVMPRPQLKDSFLDEAFALSKKGTRIYYYDFCLEDEIDKILEMIREKAKENKKKVKILNYKRAGGYLAPGKIRLRVDFLTL